MAWQYSAWRSQPTAAAQLTMLNQHLAEVSDQIGLEISGDGKSRSSSSLVEYERSLEERREKLQRLVGMVGGGVSVTSHRGGSFSSPKRSYEED